jgi:hypothetical protein
LLWFAAAPAFPALKNFDPVQNSLAQRKIHDISVVSAQVSANARNESAAAYAGAAYVLKGTTYADRRESQLGHRGRLPAGLQLRLWMSV